MTTYTLKVFEDLSDLGADNTIYTDTEVKDIVESLDGGWLITSVDGEKLNLPKNTILKFYTNEF